MSTCEQSTTHSITKVSLSFYIILSYQPYSIVTHYLVFNSQSWTSALQTLRMLRNNLSSFDSHPKYTLKLSPSVSQYFGKDSKSATKTRVGSLCGSSKPNDTCQPCSAHVRECYKRHHTIFRLKHSLRGSLLYLHLSPAMGNIKIFHGSIFQSSTAMRGSELWSCTVHCLQKELLGTASASSTYLQS
jgi:hypothetical protein